MGSSYSCQFYNFEQPETSLLYVLIGVSWVYICICGKVERLTEIKYFNNTNNLLRAYYLTVILLNEFAPTAQIKTEDGLSNLPSVTRLGGWRVEIQVSEPHSLAPEATFSNSNLSQKEN